MRRAGIEENTHMSAKPATKKRRGHSPFEGRGTPRGRVAVVLVFWIAGLAVASPERTAPPPVGTAFVSVSLDGVRLGEDFTSNFNSLFPTIVFDSTAGVFHLWVFDGSGFRLSALRHAASTDGVHFTSTGKASGQTRHARHGCLRPGEETARVASRQARAKTGPSPAARVGAARRHGAVRPRRRHRTRHRPCHQSPPACSSASTRSIRRFC
jgi:hypothetical protein